MAVGRGVAVASAVGRGVAAAVGRDVIVWVGLGVAMAVGRGVVLAAADGCGVEVGPAVGAGVTADEIAGDGVAAVPVGTGVTGRGEGEGVSSVGRTVGEGATVCVGPGVALDVGAIEAVGSTIVGIGGRRWQETSGRQSANTAKTACRQRQPEIGFALDRRDRQAFMKRAAASFHAPVRRTERFPPL